MLIKIKIDNMSVASAAASAVGNRASGAMGSPGGLAGVLGGNGSDNANPSMAALIQKARARISARKNRGAIGSAASAVGGDNGRLDTIESRLDALEGSTEGDVTQSSPTVNVPTSPEEGIGATPALPEATMATAEKMFGGGAIRQIAAGAGKFKK
jgi:hypothetical protein